MRLVLISLCVMPILAGCGGKAFTGIDSDYPSSWPKLRAVDQGCPDISGRWMDRASYTFLYRGESDAYLSYRFTGSNAKAAAISIAVEANGLVVDYLLDQGGTAKRTFRLEKGKDFVCENGAIWLGPRVQSGADGTGGYRAQTRLGLRSSVAGTLVGEERLSSVGAALWIIPVVGSQTYWFQWQRME